MPDSIVLPILEIPPITETRNFGGGLEVASVRLSFKSMVETFKDRIIAKNSTGELSNFETYEFPGDGDGVPFTIEILKGSGTPWTYADHIREGQKKFITPGERLGADILKHGYHDGLRDED